MTEADPAPCIVLASGSPRRRELVQLLGLAWRVAPQEVVEEDHLLEEPMLAALNVALAKARVARAFLAAGEVVLSADTLVVLDDRVLGKPADEGEAAAMLRGLRGRPHRVLTGVVLADGDRGEWGSVVSTVVHMREYSVPEIHAYVERGEPFDKAGGYAVQDRLFQPVERIGGCYLNVVGLPLCAVARGLETLGVPAPGAPTGQMIPPCSFCRAGAQAVQIV